MSNCDMSFQSSWLVETTHLSFLKKNINNGPFWDQNLFLVDILLVKNFIIF